MKWYQTENELPPETGWFWAWHYSEARKCLVKSEHFYEGIEKFGEDYSIEKFPVWAYLNEEDKPYESTIDKILRRKNLIKILNKLKGKESLTDEDIKKACDEEFD